MNNLPLSKLFFQIAELLELQNIPWKPQAYRKVAQNISLLSEDIADIYKNKGLEGLKSIPGVGENISKKIVEFLNTGKILSYERLKTQLPKGLLELVNIQGIGPKRAVILQKKLGITSLKQLELSAKAGKIHSLEGFGKKSEQEILISLKRAKQTIKRHLLSEFLPLAENICQILKKHKNVLNADIAGSLRRMQETIGDVDILVSSTHPKEISKLFISLPEVERVLANGKTRSSVMFRGGFQIDLRIIPNESYGSALQYFTGNKEHNVQLRKIAISKDFKLSEYGLFEAKTKRFIEGNTEKNIYTALGLKYIDPELRQANGEIEASQKRNLPKLISYDSLRGDLHVHTNESDGVNDLQTMVSTAQNMGYEYIAITDHSKHTTIANGLNEKRLLKQHEQIEKLRKKFPRFNILHGCEVDILGDGSLDIADKVLRKLDLVNISIHSQFKLSREIQTKRILKALSNPLVSCWCHPSARILLNRPEIDIDWDEILQFAVDNKVLLEINSSPERLDLRDALIHKAKDFGAKFLINTDAHAKEQFKFAKYGIAQARRGWLTADDAANTLPYKKLVKFL